MTAASTVASSNHVVAPATTSSSTSSYLAGRDGSTVVRGAVPAASNYVHDVVDLDRLRVVVRPLSPREDDERSSGTGARGKDVGGIGDRLALERVQPAGSVNVRRSYAR